MLALQPGKPTNHESVLNNDTSVWLLIFPMEGAYVNKSSREPEKTP